MKRKRLICFLALSALVLGLLLLGMDPLLARYGGSDVRERIMRDWVNQRGRLSSIQKLVTFSLLDADVNDPKAAGWSIAVLKAHFKEDEDKIVRELVYVAFTTKEPYDCHVALSALEQVSPRNEQIATATCLHFLNKTQTATEGNAMKLASGMQVLARFSCLDGLPRMRELTNASDPYLAYVANGAVAKLEASLENEPRRANYSGSNAPVER